MKTLLLLLMILSSPALADEWTTADTKRESVYLTLHTIDWLQTRNIARNPGRCFRPGYTDCYELNPILGKTPSISEVNHYFLATAALHFAIARYLPAEYRSAFQYLSIGHDLGYVSHNFKIGVSAGF